MPHTLHTNSDEYAIETWRRLSSLFGETFFFRSEIQVAIVIYAARIRVSEYIRPRQPGLHTYVYAIVPRHLAFSLPDTIQLLRLPWVCLQTRTVPVITSYNLPCVTIDFDPAKDQGIVPEESGSGIRRSGSVYKFDNDAYSVFKLRSLSSNGNVSFTNLIQLLVSFACSIHYVGKYPINLLPHA